MLCLQKLSYAALLSICITAVHAGEYTVKITHVDKSFHYKQQQNSDHATVKHRTKHSANGSRFSKNTYKYYPHYNDGNSYVRPRYESSSRYHGTRFGNTYVYPLRGHSHKYYHGNNRHDYYSPQQRYYQNKKQEYYNRGYADGYRDAHKQSKRY